MASTRTAPGPTTRRFVGALRRRARASGLVGASSVVALLLLSPLVFLGIQASQTGRHELSRLLFRHLTTVLLGNTVRLAVIVTLGCAVVGTSAAFLIERTAMPWRRGWSVLVVIPLAIPDFVVAYSWVSIAPSVHGIWGASLVMTLALYPLVYLPVAAALRRTDPALEEIARTLGVGPLGTFCRVTLRQIRTAVLGGCLVVCLALLSEYGAFEVLRYQTFTTTIFSEFSLGFNSAAACALSIVLVLIGVSVLAGEAALNRGDRSSRSTTVSTRSATRRELGNATVPAVVGLGVLVVLALGVPVGTIVWWLTHSHATTLPGTSILVSTWHTASYAAGAAALASAAALPVALAAVRHRSALSRLIERSTYLVQSVPGLIIALSLVFFGIHYAPRLYQTATMLTFAYAIIFFPLALICLLASVAQAPVELEQVGRSLGKGRIAVFLRVTLPLIGPGIAAAFCLVFLSAVTELTATLLLIPTGDHTLATQFWAYENNASYGAAAPYAAMMVGIAVVPTYVLASWFDRRTSRSPVDRTVTSPLLAQQ